MLVAAALVFSTASVARSDQVVTAGESYPRVSIVGCADGDLQFRMPDGSVRVAPLVEVTGLVVDTVGGLADLNEAERHFEQQRWQEAAVRYERALRVAPGFWAAIINHRLLQTYDRLGKLDRAVNFFVRTAADSPTAAARLLPSNLPDGRTGAVRRALKRLSAEAKSADGAERRALMELLAYALMAGTDDPNLGPHTDSIARLQIPASINTPATCAVKLLALERLLAQGAYGRVLLSADEMMRACPPEVLPDLLLLRGRALFERNAGREELLHAGLAFMRVAIHFPEHERAPEALFWAAKVHEQIDRPRKAIQLLNECLAHPRIGDPLRARAQAEIDQLAAALADPGHPDDDANAAAGRG